MGTRGAILIHAGAKSADQYFWEHQQEYRDALEKAVRAGYEQLHKGRRAIDAVEAAVRCMEDDPLFNAGRGSALNSEGEVEMDASIMEGSERRSGAVAVIRNIRNPVSLARYVLEHTQHIVITGKEALVLAEHAGLSIEKDAYFITTHQYNEYVKSKESDSSLKKLLLKGKHGTVGAVAVDKHGHIAAATSTGGLANSLPGRIGDSGIIGAGCYADNRTCAVAGTGDGEYLARDVIAHSISMMLELTGLPLQECCNHVVHVRNKGVKGDIGVISVNPSGDFGIAFNAEIMPRAGIDKDGKFFVAIQP